MSSSNAWSEKWSSQIQSTWDFSLHPGKFRVNTLKWSQAYLSLSSSPSVISSSNHSTVSKYYNWQIVDKISPYFSFLFYLWDHKTRNSSLFCMESKLWGKVYENTVVRRYTRCCTQLLNWRKQIERMIKHILREHSYVMTEKQMERSVTWNELQTHFHTRKGRWITKIGMEKIT